jgi:hypothetical protein
MKNKFINWITSPFKKDSEDLDQRLTALEIRLRDFQENSTVNLYLYVDGKKIAVKEDYYSIPPKGSYLDYDEDSNLLFRVDRIIYSELGFCIDVHGQFCYRNEINERSVGELLKENMI